jgi:hypothetical protein
MWRVSLTIWIFLRRPIHSCTLMDSKLYRTYCCDISCKCKLFYACFCDILFRAAIWHFGMLNSGKHGSKTIEIPESHLRHAHFGGFFHVSKEVKNRPLLEKLLLMGWPFCKQKSWKSNMSSWIEWHNQKPSHATSLNPNIIYLAVPESIEWFIEDQGSSASPPLSRQ